MIPKPSAVCAELIQHFEDFRPRSELSDGAWIIGYGSHFNPRGERVQPGQTIYSETAAKWVAVEIVRLTREALEKNLPQLVDLAQFQVDALCSFIYNVGVNVFKKSMLLRWLREGRFEEAAEEFTKWPIAGGNRSNGRMRRRITEREIFRGKPPWEAWETGWKEIGITKPSQQNPFRKELR